DWWYGMYLTDMRPLPAFTADWRRLRGRPRGKRLTKRERKARGLDGEK
ncbi:MAG: hypothetical protein QOE24_280, partial [Frankiales bacterium]|nr:hypothetical protein [Frankiales bacterium]